MKNETQTCPAPRLLNGLLETHTGGRDKMKSLVFVKLSYSFSLSTPSPAACWAQSWHCLQREFQLGVCFCSRVFVNSQFGGEEINHTSVGTIFTFVILYVLMKAFASGHNRPARRWITLVTAGGSWLFWTVAWHQPLWLHMWEQFFCEVATQNALCVTFPL